MSDEQITIERIERAIAATFVCSACGADRHCDCNAPAVPKAQQALEALKANPEKSDRAIAAELGVNKDTVNKARHELAGTGQLKDGPRTGLDGKVRKQPVRKPKPETQHAAPAPASNGDYRPDGWWNEWSAEDEARAAAEQSGLLLADFKSACDDLVNMTPSDRAEAISYFKHNVARKAAA
jgi:hypothetical protein